MKRGFAAQFGERLKFLSPQQATGYFAIFTTAHRAMVPHFRFKKDLRPYPLEEKWAINAIFT